MVALATQVLLLFGLGQIQATLAPDQPVPSVYIDEPLVIEFLSPVDTTCSVELDLYVPGQEPRRISLGSHRIAAGRPKWVSVDSLSPFFGRHVVRLSIQEGDATRVITGQFHRIERPNLATALPLCVNLRGISENLLYALHSVPVPALRVEADRGAGLEEALRARQLNEFRVHVHVRDGEDVGRESLKELAASHAAAVDVWELSTAQGPLRLLDMARAIRSGSPDAQIHAVLANPAELGELLAEDTYREINGALLVADGAAGNPIRAAVRTAERAGYERYPIRWFPESAEENEAHHEIVKRLIVSLSEGGAGVCLDAADVYRVEHFGPTYDILCAATRLLGGTAYAGRIAGEKDAQGLVFRDLSEQGLGEAWVVALWRNGPEKGSLTVPVSELSNIELLDASGNPLPLPAEDEGSLSIQLTNVPRYLRGWGDSILEETALQEVRRGAAELLEDKALVRSLDAETVAALRNLSRFQRDSKGRTEYLILLRSFPVVEWEWNQGTLDTAVAVPALARLAGLARHMAVLEQRSGEPFLDPLERTLSSCVEFQRQILEESGQGFRPGPRVDWLMDEVSRLSAEARHLAKLGRNIEAQAVAALAEWRARCLEVAGGPLYRPSERISFQDR